MLSKIGLIGGSGFNNPTLINGAQDQFSGTRWGEPSSPLLTGTIEGVPVVHLARHGRSHTLSPSVVNYRANIQALKDAGCTHILATTAVGSLREEIRRGDLVIIDQFIDFTRRRCNTFHEYFEPHNPVHVSLGTPFNAAMRQVLIGASVELGFAHHPTGTVVTIEGPRFSTRAESHMFRTFGADIINMSLATECALAAEAGLPYAAVAMSTDYDSWKTDEEPVSWEQVFEVFKSNVSKVESLIRTAIPRIAELP